MNFIIDIWHKLPFRIIRRLYKGWCWTCVWSWCLTSFFEEIKHHSRCIG